MADNSTKIVITAEDKTQAALASVRNGLKGMESTFAGLDNIAGRLPMIGTALATAFGAVSFTGIVKGAIDAADEMNDLSQKIGISVEDLAGFKLAAEQSGTSLEGIAKGVKALSRNMAENGDKLRAAGITATDATGALIQVADAFAAMPDGMEKTAIAIELFGKAGADMIPMLNGGGAALRDLLVDGRRLYPVTAEMAKQADAFNDSLAKLKITAGGVGMSIANEMLPPLNALSERLASAFSGGLIEGFTSRWAAAFKGLAAGINETLAASEEFLAKITFGKVAENHLKQALAYRDAAKAIYAELSALAPVGTSKAEGKASGPVPNLAGLASGKVGAGKTAKAPPALMDETDVLFNITEAVEKLNRAGMDEASKGLDDLKKRVDALYGSTAQGQFDQFTKNLEDAQRAFQEGFINQDQLNAIESKLFGVNDELAKTKSIGQELGLTFTSAFEDAIIGGKKFGEVLTAIGNDIARYFVRKGITEPLLKGLDSIDFGSLLNFGGGRAAGGSVTPGNYYVVGENGPEVLVPGTSGTVLPNGASGGGSNVVVNVIESPGNGGKTSQRQENGVNILDVFVEKVKSAIATDISDGRGAIPAAMSNTYGLNRTAGAY